MADDRNKGRLADPSAGVLDDLVSCRRSIRKYKDDPLPAPWLEALLHCAQQAPSPSNSQPVRFVHICSEQHIQALKQSLADGHRRLIARHKAMDGTARLRNWINAYHRYAQVMFAAPVLLAAGAITEVGGFSAELVAAGLYEDQSRHQTDVDMTVGLAIQNLMLKAQSLRVGSCILTAPLVFIDHVEEVLSLDNISIKCFVSLGIADEAPKHPGRMPLDAVITVI